MERASRRWVRPAAEFRLHARPQVAVHFSTHFKQVSSTFRVLLWLGGLTSEVAIFNHKPYGRVSAGSRPCGFDVWGRLIRLHLRELLTPVIATEARGLGPFCKRSRPRIPRNASLNLVQKGPAKVGMVLRTPAVVSRGTEGTDRFSSTRRSFYGVGFCAAWTS